MTSVRFLKLAVYWLPQWNISPPPFSGMTCLLKYEALSSLGGWTDVMGPSDSTSVWPSQNPVLSGLQNMRSFWSFGDSVLETKWHIPAYNSLAPNQIHHRPNEDSWKHEKISGFIPTLFQNNMLRCKVTPGSFDASKECIFYLPTFPDLYLSPFWYVGVPALRSYLSKLCYLPSRGTRQRSGGGREG